jgi:hypothetical protein
LPKAETVALGGSLRKLSPFSSGVPFLKQVLRHRVAGGAHRPVGEHDGVRRNPGEGELAVVLKIILLVVS